MSLPTVDQAEAIREVLGIRKRMAPEAIAAERVRLAHARSAAGGSLNGQISLLDSPGCNPPCRTFRPFLRLYAPPHYKLGTTFIADVEFYSCGLKKAPERDPCEQFADQMSSRFSNTLPIRSWTN